MTERLAAIAASIAAPVPGPSPAGADVTYEPAFERLRETVDALGSVGTAVDHESVGEGPFGGGGGADHRAVVDDALTVLTEQSKDVRAAGYLVASLAHTDGAAGVEAGLRGLAGLARAYWDGLFPTRARARRGAFEYVVTRVQAALEGAPAPTAAEADALGGALEALADLEGVVRDAMGDQAPAFSGLRRTLTQRQKRVPSEPAADPPTPVEEPAAVDLEDAAAAGVEAVPTATSRPSAPVEPGALDPARAVYQAAAALREGEPGSAVAVRLVRVVRWDGLAAAPPAADGKTRVEAPPARQRAALSVLAESDPALFAESAEAAFVGPGGHLWLDLQRLEDGALAGLGPPYAGARAALRAETSRLLDRLPTLATLSFRDGTPFADAATQGWLRGLQPAAPRREDPADAQGSALDDARAAVEGGDLTSALALLGAARPAGGRAGFVHRLQTATLCLEAGRADLAWGLLQALAVEAERGDLDAWEPALAADLHDAFALAAGQTGHADQAAAARLRLAAVAPDRAARYPAA